MVKAKKPAGQCRGWRGQPCLHLPGKTEPVRVMRDVLEPLLIHRGEYVDDKAGEQATSMQKGVGFIQMVVKPE